MTQETKLPLCEAIRAEAESALEENDFATPYEKGVEAGIRLALELNDKHFAALSVDDVITAMCQAQGEDPNYPPAREEKRVKAQAVMQLLRKE